MTNQDQTVLYTGVTNDLQRRVNEHRTGKGVVFSKKYKLHMLVYYEEGESVLAAISREKIIKGGSRQKKIDLINNLNPKWEDLYDNYFSNDNIFCAIARSVLYGEAIFSIHSKILNSLGYRA
jgi:putative endonuclease